MPNNSAESGPISLEKAFSLITTMQGRLCDQGFKQQTFELQVNEVINIQNQDEVLYDNQSTRIASLEVLIQQEEGRIDLQGPVSSSLSVEIKTQGDRISSLMRAQENLETKLNTLLGQIESRKSGQATQEVSQNPTV